MVLRVTVSPGLIGEDVEEGYGKVRRRYSPRTRLHQTFPKFRFGSSDRAFGTPGAGGSFGFADPDTRVGFAYAMNKAGFHLYNDPRELALRQAVFHDILGATSQT